MSDRLSGDTPGTEVPDDLATMPAEIPEVKNDEVPEEAPGDAVQWTVPE